MPADLPDGAAYTPVWFLDAQASIGTASTRDGKWLRLLLRTADGSLRELRRLSLGSDSSFPAITSSGQVVVWAESEGARNPRLWMVDLRDGKAPTLITADTGAARFYQSQFDLVVADGQLHWVAAAGVSTEIRSVALTGGPVQVTKESASWQLSAWPWLVDGVTSASGSTMLKNLVTGRDVAVAATSRAVSNCSPTWCRAVSLTSDGYSRIDVMHPDGTARRKVAQGPVETAVADVAVLDRFEIFAQTGGNADLTGNAQLLIYDIIGRRTVEVSPDAANVVYRGGVLCWSTGNLDLFLRHALDLRTI